jgi:fructoselysine-6-P-deglycase FrlB-like protein
LKKEWGRLIFTGSGDSLSAAQSLQFAATKYLDFSVLTTPSFEMNKYLKIYPSDLIVVTSFSGETPQAIEAAEFAKQSQAFVLAITANSTSSLAQISDYSLKIEFQSRSRKIPHASDYMTTLLALATLIEHISGITIQSLEDLSNQVQKQITNLENFCLDIGKTLVENENFYFFGAGPSFGIAQYGAAKFWEAGGIKAFSFEIDEMYHGPYRLVDPDDPVFIILPEGASIDLGVRTCKGFKEVGARVHVITNKPELFPNVFILKFEPIKEEWSPLLSCIPIQLLCWAVAESKGYDVIKKDGRQPNPEIYKGLHRALEQ